MQRWPAATTTFTKQEEKALQSMRNAIDRFQPDFFLAGPAFNAGRYGIACAKACSWVRDNWRIPAITGMHENNPGTQEIGRQVFVMQTGTSTASMAEAAKRFSALLELLMAQDPAGAEAFRAEHCLPIPRRFTVRTGKPDYVRAVDLLLAKLSGETYESEIPLIATAKHAIPNLTGSLKDATVALVTEGGLVPKGNPDRLESSRGSRYFKYSLAGLDDLRCGDFAAMHIGYDTSMVDEDPDRMCRWMRCASWRRTNASRNFTRAISSPPAPARCRARWLSSAPASPENWRTPV